MAVERTSKRPGARPIFHLSIPVRDLAEAVDFYSSWLDAQIGRSTATFADALVFGAQVTLQNDPSNVSDPMPRTRHFGATLPWSQWERITARFDGSPLIVEPATVSFAGEPVEQAKIMVTDPSGNLIEVKAYRNPKEVLGPLADL